MSPPDPTRVFLPGFEAAGFPYMITGGVGAIIYGEPRMTNDMDIVLSLDPSGAERLVDAFRGAEFHVPPLEAIRQEAARARHGRFNLIHLESLLRADVYLAGGDPLPAWGLDHRRRMALGGGEGWVAPPEHVILQKLLYFNQCGSDRHLRDIAWMLRVSDAQIDHADLAARIRQAGVDQEWALARRTRLDA